MAKQNYDAMSIVELEKSLRALDAQMAELRGQKSEIAAALEVKQQAQLAAERVAKMSKPERDAIILAAKGVPATTRTGKPGG